MSIQHKEFSTGPGLSLETAFSHVETLTSLPSLGAGCPGAGMQVLERMNDL